MAIPRLTEQFNEVLERLDLKFNGSGNTGLLFVSDLKKRGLSPKEVFGLETAKHYRADAVYFRKFDDNRPAIPQIYIYDNTKNKFQASEYAAIQRALWSACLVPLFLIVEKSQVLIFDSRKPIDIFFDQISADPIETIKITSQALKDYSAKLFDNGSFWEKENTANKFLESTSAYNDLIEGLKKIRKTFLSKINLPSKTAHKLLVLSILIKYLEERGDEGETLFAKNFFKQFNADNFCDVLRNKGQIVNLFLKLSEHFNGQIFSWTDQAEAALLKNCDLTLLADFLDANTKDNQYVLWRRYSFNHLPVELISSVYEEFLGNDKKDVVYTPHFLVNTLVDASMPLDQPKEKFKLIDVSCGSGIFLVVAYKRLVEWWRYKKYIETGSLPPNPDIKVLKNLLKSSIFGFDIQEDATRLTIFSLALALCDLLSPKQIWTELKFDDLSKENVVNSDFFEKLPQTNNDFDLVIGNPPFIELNESEINGIIGNNSLTVGCKIPQNQIALLFLEQSMRLLKKDATLCLIMPSGPLLYNDTLDFRKYFFEKYGVTQILDFTNLSSTLFGANVATSAIFVCNRDPNKNEGVSHVTIRRTKSSKEKIFFEIDHYDFHTVSFEEAISERYVWKANLLGGERINVLIKRLSQLPTLEDFLKYKKHHNSWVFGDGFIKGKDDSQITDKDLQKKKGGYAKADYLTGSLSFNPEDFDEDGIKRKFILKDIYFQWKRSPQLFQAPLLLIKKNIGKSSIPVYYSEKQISFKNEVVGIHAPPKDKNELKQLAEFIKGNQTYRFYLSTTSARSGISRSTSTLLQEDILNLPFPKDLEDLKLSFAEKILRDDVLNYTLEQISKGENAEVNKPANDKHLKQFASVFCKALNSVYDDGVKKFRLHSFISTNTFTALVVHYSNKEVLEVRTYGSKKAEDEIADLVYSQTGKNIRINRSVKLYQSDKIYLIKPKQLRYWLKSIALRDADETLNDLIKAGY